MTKRAKQGKELKDLDPKGRGKNVKGGRLHTQRDKDRVFNRDAKRVVSRVGDAIDNTADELPR